MDPYCIKPGAGCASCDTAGDLSLDARDDLVVATPERVTFQYQVAGIGSRFLAQTIDSLVIFGIQLILLIGVVALGFISQNPTVAIAILILLSFLLLFGYFILSEAVWSGQTLGKRALRLRVVGDAGQPVTFSQAAIRNLVRIVDFLPAYYGVGLVVMFSNSQNKRLGDLAAGTLVVRERARISLEDLVRSLPPIAPEGAPPAPAPAVSAAPQMEPGLRRFVSSYARRRAELDPRLRLRLAESVEPSLRQVVPDLVATSGPLAALDHLADLESASP